jgi:L-alanine-DL-glutamate epimerase-like enolase superfamily enzyme
MKSTGLSASPASAITAGPSAPVPAVDESPDAQRETWHARRQAGSGREWLHVELSADGAARGEAWGLFSDDLAAAIAAQTRNGRARPVRQAGEERPSLIASGLIEAARLDARCRQLGVPLHLWLGGALRNEVAVTLPIRIAAAARASRRVQLDRERERIRCGVDVGVDSFAVYETSRELEQIVELVAAVRSAAGSSARIGVRLAGQLSDVETEALLSMLSGYDVESLGDPCETVPLNVLAVNGSLPALGLSAWRYDRGALLHAFAISPPTTLFVDPMLEGGITATRQLSAVATVLQFGVALTSSAGGWWLAAQCASLAAVLPSVDSPVELPLSWTPALLQALNLQDGAVTLDAIPRLAQLQAGPNRHP